MKMHVRTARTRAEGEESTDLVMLAGASGGTHREEMTSARRMQTAILWATLSMTKGGQLDIIFPILVVICINKQTIQVK